MFKVDVNFEPLKKKHVNLKQYQAKIKNPVALAETLKSRIIASNRARALKGNDHKGKPFAPLRPITLATRRGSGPPLAPMRGGSRIVKNFVVDYKISNGKITLTAGWRDMDFMKYHITGYRHRSGRWVPARNANGVPRNLDKTMRADAKAFYKMDGKVNFKVQEYNEA